VQKHPPIRLSLLITEITSEHYLDPTPLGLSNIEHIQRKSLGYEQKRTDHFQSFSVFSRHPPPGKSSEREEVTMSSKFPHRHNSDGSYDLICTACFVTVASVRDEELLRGHELAHVCDPVNLYRIESLKSVSLWTTATPQDDAGRVRGSMGQTSTCSF
jgi:hypothetical protein